MELDAVGMCADAAAAWHASWLSALGLRSERRRSVWCALDPPPPIYWTAITLSPDASAADVSDADGTICDSWGTLELAAHRFGEADRGVFEEAAREPWFVRPPGTLAGDHAPPELELIRVGTPEEVAEFEDVSFRGFAGEGASVEPGSIHPASILADTRMTMLTGRVGGNAVAAGMSYRTDTGVGIYGVTTVESARGRGYATVLTRALIDPSAPTSLSPSPEARNLYRRLGFEQVGELRQWRRS